MDNFEFEEDEFNEDQYDQQANAEHLANMYELKDRLARANYEAIVKHGIDTDKTGDTDMILNIIEETMFYFEELEEYEKCAKLKKEMQLFK
jgi:hypothetical protein